MLSFVYWKVSHQLHHYVILFARASFELAVSHNISILTLFYSRSSWISTVFYTKLWSSWTTSSAIWTKSWNISEIADVFSSIAPICKKFVFIVSFHFRLWYIIHLFILFDTHAASVLFLMKLYSPRWLKIFIFFSALWDGRSSQQGPSFCGTIVRNTQCLERVLVSCCFYLVFHLCIWYHFFSFEYFIVFYGDIIVVDFVFFDFPVFRTIRPSMKYTLQLPAGSVFSTRSVYLCTPNTSFVPGRHIELGYLSSLDLNDGTLPYKTVDQFLQDPDFSVLLSRSKI